MSWGLYYHRVYEFNVVFLGRESEIKFLSHWESRLINNILFGLFDEIRNLVNISSNLRLYLFCKNLVLKTWLYLLGVSSGLNSSMNYFEALFRYLYDWFDESFEQLIHQIFHSIVWFGRKQNPSLCLTSFNRYLVYL